MYFTNYSFGGNVVFLMEHAIVQIILKCPVFEGKQNNIIKLHWDLLYK
jgi:hypothetical protein